MFFRKKKEEVKDNDVLENLFKSSYNMECNVIEEAKVYFAYGREKQAMEILNEALAEGVLSKEEYNSFLASNKSLQKEKVDIKKETHTYYVSITYIVNFKFYKKRLEIHLTNKIENKNGIKELEIEIGKVIPTEEWSLDSFIKITD